ncbi:MAG: hypothetical protein JHC33_13580 [Ignisphaera sp.]|nr:hypothetical protein [Ignisphaera sp.]
MAFTMIDARKNAMLDTFTSGIGASPLLRIYDATGGVPANANTALGSQVVLGTLTFSATPFPAASAGTLTANAITQDSAADATGTAAFYRILNSAGTVTYAQGTVGTSGADLNLNTTSIVLGGPISVTSLTISI